MLMPKPIIPKRRTGGSSRTIEIPADFIAAISLSAAILPRPRRTPIITEGGKTVTRGTGKGRDEELEKDQGQVQPILHGSFNEGEKTRYEACHQEHCKTKDKRYENLSEDVSINCWRHQSPGDDLRSENDSSERLSWGEHAIGDESAYVKDAVTVRQSGHAYRDSPRSATQSGTSVQCTVRPLQTHSSP